MFLVLYKMAVAYFKQNQSQKKRGGVQQSGGVGFHIPKYMKKKNIPTIPN
jgi:hypothetical protein